MAGNRRTSKQRSDRQHVRPVDHYVDEFDYTDGNLALQPELQPEEHRTVRRKKKVTVYRSSTVYGLRYFIFMCTAIAATVLCSYFYMKTQAQVSQKASEVAEQQADLADLQAENKSMKENLTRTVDLDEVYDYAVNVLGMSYPDKDQIIYYDSSNDSYIHQFEAIPDNN